MAAAQEAELAALQQQLEDLEASNAELEDDNTRMEAQLLQQQAAGKELEAQLQQQQAASQELQEQLRQQQQATSQELQAQLHETLAKLQEMEVWLQGLLMCVCVGGVSEKSSGAETSHALAEDMYGGGCGLLGCCCYKMNHVCLLLEAPETDAGQG